MHALLTPPAVERLSCAPSCRGEKERVVSRGGAEGGAAENVGGIGTAFLWAVGCLGCCRQAFLPSFPSSSQPPRHRKGPGSFFWQ